MRMFVGKSGRFYVKNPFDSGRYCYAVYQSRDHYDKRMELPTYVNSSTAYADYDVDRETAGYCFVIFDGKEEKLRFRTTLVGQLIDITGYETGKEYLEHLKNQYGAGFRFHYEKCELCETAA